MSVSDNKMHLTAFYYPPGSYASGWRMPDAIPESDMTFRHHAKIATESERGKFDAIFYQDTAGIQGTADLEAKKPVKEQYTRVARLEPLMMMPAMAMLTKHIGLLATTTTSFNEPYHVARRFATLDHISRGRAGWNVVTSQIEDEALNFGFDAHIPHAERYERASEFYDAVEGLWDSWEGDALLRNKETGQYFDPSKVHLLNHVGKYFNVRGPLNIARCPQGRPVIAQAGSSADGMELAARTAEIVFTAQRTPEEARAFYSDLKGRLSRYGREPDSMKIMPGVVPIVGRTESEAKEIYDQLQSLITDDVALGSVERLTGGLDLRKYDLDGPLPDLPPTNSAKARQALLIEMARKDNLSIRQVARKFAEGTGHNLIYGSPTQIADMMEHWFKTGAADGFTILFSHYPAPVTDFMDLVVPELQRRKLFRTEYEGTTLRDHLKLRTPQNRYTKNAA